MAKKMPPYPIFNPLDSIPVEMDPWQMRMQLPNVNPDYGTFEAVLIEPCPIEQAHTVDVLDEYNIPLYGAYVIFGYPGATQPDLSYLKPRVNYWNGAPDVLAGNAQKTDFSGHTQHTTGKEGGEDIWIWYVVPNPLKGNQLELYLSSSIVKNCRSIATNINSHTGVHIVFRRAMNLGNVAEAG